MFDGVEGAENLARDNSLGSSTSKLLNGREGQISSSRNEMIYRLNLGK